MKINITIFNDHGELLDKQFNLSLDEIRNIDMNLLVDEAERNGEEDGLLNLTNGTVEYDERNENN